MKKLKGNLIDWAEHGYFDVIVHGCNCFHTMGAGIAKEIAERHPQAYIVDKNNTKYGDAFKLGTYSYGYVQSETKPEHYFYIVNAYTQYYYGKDKNDINLIYSSLRECFRKIARDFSGHKIAYPKIGSGLAGGDWKIISRIINEELKGLDHTLIIFE